MKRLTSLLTLAILIVISQHAVAKDSAIESVRAKLAIIIPNIQADNISATPLPDIYEVSYGSEIFYISRDGGYILQGDLYDIKTNTNLTEGKRNTGRKTLLESISNDTKIIFKAKNTRHVIDIYTDIDCGYCRKLHQQISEYTDAGIEIRYLAYPRSGINTDSYYKAVTVWCAADQHQALTLAKQGNKMKYTNCEHPVDAHMTVASKIGISGTPTMVFADGSVMPGYVPPAQLIDMLDNRFPKNK